VISQRFYRGFTAATKELWDRWRREERVCRTAASVVVPENFADDAALRAWEASLASPQAQHGPDFR
jgi:hypothetical protein